MSNNVYEETNSESLEGKILIASPHLDDQYFSRSLVYICAHDASGAIGIMINQRIGMISYGDFMMLGDQSKVSDSVKNKKFPLMFGGPVNTDMLIALSLNKKDKLINLKTNDVIVNTDVGKFFKDIIKNKKLSEKFIWDSQELEEEISDNAWFVIPASSDIIFSQKTKDKWKQMIRKLGILNTHELVKYSGSS